MRVAAATSGQSHASERDTVAIDTPASLRRPDTRSHRPLIPPRESAPGRIGLPRNANHCRPVANHPACSTRAQPLPQRTDLHGRGTRRHRPDRRRWPHRLARRRSVGPADHVVDLDGALVTPAFVDAHVHATGAGLSLTGLDLSGAESLRDALDRVERHNRSGRGRPVLGHGWDDTNWPETPPATWPTRPAAYGARCTCPGSMPTRRPSRPRCSRPRRASGRCRAFDPTAG